MIHRLPPQQLLLIGWLLLVHQPHCIQADDTKVLSCSCALEENDDVLDCDNSSGMLGALSNLQSNACQLDCTSEVCQANYYMVQAHHDYCLRAEIPGSLSSGFHSFEEKCQDCHVIRHTDPSLPSCPAANCEDTSGNAAYAFLLQNECQQDCDTNPDCGRNFRTLRAVYDTCPDGVLGLLTELGLNDLATPCASQDCNTGHASTDASQLVCNTEDAATRPPAGASETTSPTATPAVECPDAVQNTPHCSVCGPNACVTKPFAVFAWPGRPEASCAQLEEAGLQGLIDDPEQCDVLPDLLQHICACATADVYVPYSGVPTPAVVAPTPPASTPATTTTVSVPTRRPTVSAAPPPTPSSSSAITGATSRPSSSAMIGLVGGIGGVVVALGAAALVVRQRRTKRSSSTPYHETAGPEIEVATFQQSEVA